MNKPTTSSPIIISGSGSGGGVVYSNRPQVDVGYVEPTLFGFAHGIFEVPKQGSKSSSTCLSTIYLGPKSAASERAHDALVEAGIDGVVNCTRRVPCYHRNNNNNNKIIRYCQVPVHDEAGAAIETYFDGATTFIHLMLHHQGSVLVHCEQGMSRSATIVIAYLMRYEGMTRDEAYIYCKKKRPMVNPNEGFWEQLKNYELKLLSNTTTSHNDNDNHNTTEEEEEELLFLPDDWPIQSFALFTTCRELTNSTGGDADDGSDNECKLILSEQPIWKALSNIKSQFQLNQLLTKCLDFVWGRGILDVDIAWLVQGVVHYVSLYVPPSTIISSESGSLSEFCQKRIRDILYDPESEFSQIWSGEIYPTDVKRIVDSMNEIACISQN